MTSYEQRMSPNSKVMFESLFKADILVLIKNRRSLVLGIILPLIILATTNGHKAQQRLGGSLLLVGLAITYGLMSTSMLGYALSIARDRDAGVFQRLRVTPAPTWMIMTSRLTIQAIANLIIALLVVIVGTSIYHLTLTLTQYAMVLAISILGGAMFLSIGQAMVGLLKSSETVNAAGRIVFAGLILLGLLGFSGVLGGTLESIATWSPVGTVMTLFSGVMNPSKWTGHDSLSLLVTFGYIACFASLGIRWFRWDTH
ncbi:MAG: hypothetical protein EPN30_01465 [Actinomycetota bacterium]|nr:MAG: hypothetical protein EPN30_01465 [Actinomycetota bacterium]